MRTNARREGGRSEGLGAFRMRRPRIRNAYAVKATRGNRILWFVLERVMDVNEAEHIQGTYEGRAVSE